MLNAARAGLVYFGLVFCAGFVLGTIRALMIAPLTGDLIAVIIELPVMLGLSWFACAWVLRKIFVPTTITAGIMMGATAFLVLMAAETMLSAVFNGRTVGEHLDLYRTTPVQAGLIGQLLFAAFPLIQWRSVRQHPSTESTE